MIELSISERALHNEATTVCTRIQGDEAYLIQILQKIEHTKLYKKFHRPSLFAYALHELKLTRTTAYSFISVARKAKEIPRLHEAIQKSEFSVAKASRIVAALTRKNAEGLVRFAIQNTCEKTDREVARINPRAGAPEKIKYLSKNLVQLTITVSQEGFEKFQRAEALAAQKGKKFLGRGGVVELLAEEYVERHDPVRKADRAAELKARKNLNLQTKTERLCVNRVFQSERVKLTAEQKHAVFARDRGRCTHVDQTGERCTNDRYLHVHHLIPVANGGTNDPDNLTTLCSSHHDLVHQLSFALENQVTWLRSPTGKYLSS